MVTAKQFIGAYIAERGDVTAISNVLDLSKPSVRARASHYRAIGVKLPKYRKGTRLNVSELNQLIKELKS